MNTPGASPVVNRGSPIPMLISDDTKKHARDSGVKGKESSSSAVDGGEEDDTTRTSKATASLQDRMFATLLQQILPQDGHASASPSPSVVAKSVERPNFSLPLMSTNFRRFNARIGVVFVFQARLIRLLSWEQPSQTLSLLAVYTLVCLRPSLLVVLPLAVCLFFIMVPAFILRHPPPPKAHPIEANASATRGPASAPAANIKPAPELSKDFFRNMRDLQNSMEDFSVVHDKLISIIAPTTNFSDERLSSALFLVLFLSSCVLFIASNLLPWRLVMLLLGWLSILSGHPAAAVILSPPRKAKIQRKAAKTMERIDKWVRKDVVLDEAPEVRQVEIFELQRQRSGSDWELWLYCNSPYDPQSPVRLSGDRPKGSRFFEDVEPPRGWEWSDKKWNLDLFSREWVEERMITAVEVETDEERWVYDIGTNDQLDTTSLSSTGSVTFQSARKRDWEEGSGHGPKGQWRRRRWVRLVQRKVLKVRKDAKK